MHKKLIAVAVAGLMSSGAFAQVTVGGKFDAGYQFRKTQNLDSGAGGATGGKTTETQTDGSAAATRVTVKATEDVNKFIKAGVDYDIRFTNGNVHEGKTGVASNDKKAMWVQFGPIVTQFGVADIMSNDYKLAEKPYAISPKDWDGVKWGVSQWHEDSLTNRNTSFWTDPKALSFGPVGFLIKGSFAGGDNRKAGDNNDGGSSSGTGKKSGDTYAFGVEYKFTDYVNGGVDGTHRRTADVSTTTSETGMIYHHYYINLKPVKGLKFAAQYNNYKGRVAGSLIPFQTKTTNFVVNYSIGDLGLGAGISHLHDLSASNGSRNSGKGLMLGVLYNLSKNTSLYLGYAKNDWERNVAGATGEKFVGTSANFAGNLGTKNDERITRIGILKDF
ncbi:porin [Viridibacterium curvum]|uniref:Porin n=1 Tax=Viridibacterium curvum TaxID=1101404 RepID=A0ABP9R0U5_9RHOO